ncbi:MAG: hypothetical protein QOH03_3250, partial [Kribbellaceae bacterium]|nr:hypothetical protein [Kribbellaceae bacterium]
GKLANVTEANGWYPETDDLHFNGYLVDLRRTEG